MVGIEAKAATYARNVYNGVPGYTIEKAKKFFASDYRIFEWWYNYYAAQKASLLTLSRYSYVGALNFKNQKDVGRIIAKFNTRQLEGFARIDKELYNIKLTIETQSRGKYNFSTEPWFKLTGNRKRDLIAATYVDLNIAKETAAIAKWTIDNMSKSSFWSNKVVGQFTDRLNKYLESSIDVLEEVTGVLHNE